MGSHSPTGFVVPFLAVLGWRGCRWGHRPGDSWQLGTGLKLISLVILVNTRWPVSLSQASEELSEWPGEGSKVGQGA